MPFKINFSIPVFRLNSWMRTEHFATLEVASEGDDLLGKYNESQSQLEKLLQQINAESQLAVDLQRLTAELVEKEDKLRIINFKIEQSQREYDCMRSFFKRLRIEVDEDYRFFDFRIGDRLQELQNDDDDDDDD